MFQQVDAEGALDDAFIINSCATKSIGPRMSKPRVAIAGFQHETNTFAPFLTTWDAFQQPGAWPAYAVGQAAADQARGLNVPIGGFVDAGENFAIVPILYAAAEPGGYVTRDAFDQISDALCAGLAKAGELDAVYLDLHGAMVTQDHDDGECELLRRVRAQVGPDMPIAVSLDLHGNLSEAFVEQTSFLSIYRTYPHTDMAQTGARAARLLETRLANDAPFCTAFRQCDFIVPITAQSTRREPGGALYRLLDSFAGDGVETVEFAFGFPPADIPDCGPSIYACGTDQAAVDAAVDAMLEALNAAEPQFDDQLTSGKTAVRYAMEKNGHKPVIIAEPQDNPGAGAPGDATGLLVALLEGNATALIGMIWDPKTAAQAHAAGVGGEIDAQIGGQFPESGGPAIPVRARVEELSDGIFTCTGPMFGGLTAHLGPMARLRVRQRGADITLVVGSNRAQNADQAVFRHIGADPDAFKLVAVKSAIHFLADYEPIAEDVLFADTPGANPCDIQTIPYTRLRAGVRLGPNGPVSG